MAQLTSFRRASTSIRDSALNRRIGRWVSTEELGAVALLRQIVEGAFADDPVNNDPVAEGGILLTGAIDFELRAKRLSTVFRASAELQVDAKKPPTLQRKSSALCCPIPGCGKVFASGRSGWDSHVGSLRMHPWWHPEIDDPEVRKAQFKGDFPQW